MSIAFLFPGQGSQYPGMLRQLPDHHEVKSIINRVEKSLNLDLGALDTEQSLKSTVAVQTCLYISGVAVARALQAEGIQPSFVAGLSVGSFGAAVISNSLAFEDGLNLVRARAASMESAYPTGYGMTAIVGLPEKRVAELIKSVASDSQPLYLSNINAAMQMVVSGAVSALTQFESIAFAAGARKTERLDVAVPSHCALLTSTAELLADQIKSIKMQTPTITYVSNLKARPLKEAEKIASDLAQNVAHCVRWYDSMCLMSELGAEIFLEMPPGDRLTRLGSEIVPDKKLLSVEDCSFAYLCDFIAKQKVQ